MFNADEFNQAMKSLFENFHVEQWPSTLLSVALTILVFYFIRKILIRLLDEIFSKKNPFNVMQNPKRNLTLLRAFNSFITWTVWSICLLVVLSYFIDIGAILAVAGVGTIAVGFAAQSMVEDIMSGLMIILEDTFNVDDYVIVDGNYGVVERIGVRTTSIRLLDGGLFSIYNGKIDRVTNYSRGSVVSAAEFTLSRQDNIDEAILVLEKRSEKIREENSSVFKVPITVIGVTAMSPTDVTVKVIAHVDASQKTSAASILWVELGAALEEAGFRTPYNKVELMPVSNTEEVMA